MTIRQSITARRRVRIRSHLKQVIAGRFEVERPERIGDNERIGPYFAELLRAVARERGYTLRRYGPINPESTLDECVEFLMTVIHR